MSKNCRLRLFLAACAATFSLALQGNLGAQTYNAGQEAARRAAEQAAQERARAAASQLDRDRQRQERERADAERRQQQNQPRNSPPPGPRPADPSGKSDQGAAASDSRAPMQFGPNSLERWKKGSAYRKTVNMNPPAGSGALGDWNYEILHDAKGQYAMGTVSSTARDPGNGATLKLTLRCDVRTRMAQERNGVVYGPLSAEVDHRQVTQGRLPTGVGIFGKSDSLAHKLEWERGGEISRMQDRMLGVFNIVLQSAIGEGASRVNVVEGGAVRNGVFTGAVIKASALISDAGFDKAYEKLAPCWDNAWWDWPVAKAPAQVVAPTPTPVPAPAGVAATVALAPPAAPTVAVSPPAPPRPAPPTAPTSAPIAEVSPAPTTAALPLVEGKLRLLNLKTVARNVFVYGMNSAGDVVGEIERSGFVWRGGGEIEYVVYPEAEGTAVAGIDDAGIVFGRYLSRHLFTGNFIRKRDGAPQHLQLPFEPGTKVLVRAVGGKGAVFGHLDRPDQKSRQFFMWVGGEFRFVSGNVGDRTAVYGADSTGVLVGGIEPLFSDQGQGFVARNGAISPFNVPGSRWTVAKGINDKGEIVGSYRDPAGALRCFRRDASAQFTTFRLPDAAYNCDASSINNSGAVAGVYQVAKQGVPRGYYTQAFVWTP